MTTAEKVAQELGFAKIVQHDQRVVLFTTHGGCFVVSEGESAWELWRALLSTREKLEQAEQERNSARMFLGISNKGWRRCLTRAKSAEAELTAMRERERWIPVSEGFPLIDSEVMVVNNNDELGPEIVAIVKRNHVMSPDNADRDDFKARGYTHWRPLPAPPAEHAQEPSR
jgi:hypothetical protein